MTAAALAFDRDSRSARCEISLHAAAFDTVTGWYRFVCSIVLFTFFNLSVLRYMSVIYSVLCNKARGKCKKKKYFQIDCVFCGKNAV